MRFSSTLLGLSLTILASFALAQTNGTYATNTGYSINVEFEGDSLVVVEPNKRSEYRKKPGSANEYEFTNANNRNIRYGLRVIDAETLGAYKPDHPTSGVTILKLRLAPGGSGSTSATDQDSEKFDALAQTYLERAQNDSANVHVWSACGAAAFARANSSQAEADAYALQTASMIKPIMTRAGSPCPEVISDTIWSSAK